LSHAEIAELKVSALWSNVSDLVNLSDLTEQLKIIQCQYKGDTASLSECRRELLAHVEAYGILSEKHRLLRERVLRKVTKGVALPTPSGGLGGSLDTTGAEGYYRTRRQSDRGAGSFSSGTSHFCPRQTHKEGTGFPRRVREKERIRKRRVRADLLVCGFVT